MYSDQRICLATQFKARLPQTKKAIMSTLGVGASTTHAYDIVAAGQGFKDYQSAKGRAGMPYYEWGLNIGGDSEPYFVMKPIGHHRNKDEAKAAGATLVNDAPDNAAWQMFENGRPTGLFFEASNLAHVDLRNVQIFLECAVENNVSELRIRHDNASVSVEQQTRKGWVSSNYSCEMSAGEVVGDVVAQLEEMAPNAKRVGNEAAEHFSFSLKIKDVHINSLVTLMKTQSGSVVRVILYSPKNLQYTGRLIEKRESFKRLLFDVSNAKNGLFLVAGKTGSGRTGTVTFLAQKVHEFTKTKNDPVAGGKHEDFRFEDMNRQLMRTEPHVIFSGEINTVSTLQSALRAAEKCVVVAQIHADPTAVISRLDAMGADMDSLNVALKGVYSQCLMRSTKRSYISPVASYQRVDKGSFVGDDLLDEARLLYFQGEFDDAEMNRQFGCRHQPL